MSAHGLYVIYIYIPQKVRGLYTPWRHHRLLTRYVCVTQVWPRRRSRDVFITGLQRRPRRYRRSPTVTDPSSTPRDLPDPRLLTPVVSVLAFVFDLRFFGTLSKLSCQHFFPFFLEPMTSLSDLKSFERRRLRVFL